MGVGMVYEAVGISLNDCAGHTLCYFIFSSY